MYSGHRGQGPGGQKEKDTCACPPCLGGEVNLAALLSAVNKWAVGADF